MTEEVGKEMDKFEKKFAADGLDMLGTYGYLALWRLFQEEKKTNPDLPILDDENASTFLNQKISTKTALVPYGCWSGDRLRLDAEIPGVIFMFRCRPSVVVFKQTLKP